MKRIFFLNRYFYPDHSATSQILGDLAFHLAAAGRQVHVITSPQRYDHPEAKLPSHEIVNGVRISRVFADKNRYRSWFYFLFPMSQQDILQRTWRRPTCTPS